MNLTDKVRAVAQGYALTLPQKQRLARSLTRKLKIKFEDELTVAEIQGLIEIVQAVLPAGLEKRAQ